MTVYISFYPSNWIYIQMWKCVETNFHGRKFFTSLLERKRTVRAPRTNIWKRARNYENVDNNLPERENVDGGIDRCCSCRGGGGHLLPSLEDSSIPCRDPPSHGQLRHRSQSSPVCKVPQSGKKCFNRRITLLAYSVCLFNELFFVRVDISSNVSSVEDSNYCLTSLWNVFI